MRAVVLRGPLSDDDLREIAAILRRADARQPDQLFEMYMIDPDASLFDAKRMVTEMLPPLDGRVTAMEAYHNESFPARQCDRCNRTYQGPAVYCSLECAILDA